MIYNYMRDYDIIPDKQYLLIWGYRIRELIKEDKSLYSRPIFRELLRSLRSLPGTGKKRIWMRRFCIWAGDHGEYFCVGIPGKIYAGVSQQLRIYLEQLPGFEFSENATTPHVPLVPMFLYDYGRIGEYDSKENAGKKYRDRNYNSGERLEGRCWLPPSYID